MKEVVATDQLGIKEPLGLDQLENLEGTPVWIASAHEGGKVPNRWALYVGRSESIDREAVYVFEVTGGIPQGYKGRDYRKTWTAYRYPSDLLDRAESAERERDEAQEKLRDRESLDTPIPPFDDSDPDVMYCQKCGSGEYLYNEDGNRNNYCGQCGQCIDWVTVDAMEKDR